MSTTVILSGGGIKSAVVTARAAAEHDVVLLHVDYGQPAAAAQSRALAVFATAWPKSRVCSLELPPLKLTQSATRVGASVGNIHAPPYQINEVHRFAGLRALMPTMLTHAAQAALQVNANFITLGLSELVNAEHVGLPTVQTGTDSLQEFLHAFDIMLEAIVGPGHRIRIDVPLIDLTYAQIIKLGQRFKIPWERTYTCEKQAAGACGQCTFCKARTQAFLDAAIPDPAAAPVQPGRTPVMAG